METAEVHPVVDLRDLRLRQAVAPGDALSYLAGYGGWNQPAPAVIPGEDFLVCRRHFLFSQGVDRVHAAADPAVIGYRHGINGCV